MIYYAEFLSEDEACRYIAFQDTTRADAEHQDYIKAMTAGRNGYTEEGLVENELFFGLVVYDDEDEDDY